MTTMLGFRLVVVSRQRLTRGLLMIGVALFSLLVVNVHQGIAQKREIGLLLGGLSTSDQTFRLPTPGSLKIRTGLTYQANYAQRLVNARVAALYFEVPFVATPSTTVQSSNVLAPRNYASIFITPGLKVKLLPAASVSPYVFAGGGYARFAESDSRSDNQPNTGPKGTNRGAVDFGGGVDIKIIPFLSLRGEVRDFYSGTPRFNLPALDNRQHNLLISGGFVVRF
ncbi:MAG: hypothetical protein HY231_00190 [Acidobacteria bacterium]|nr:hypothetical protein [Acidobacteriota bacterium]